MFGRRPRTLLDLVFPNIATRVQRKQENQKVIHDKSAKERSFKVSDTVYIKKFPNSKEWLPGKIVKVLGPLSFEIETNDGTTVRRHIDHIRSRHTQSKDADKTSQQLQDDWIEFPDKLPTPHPDNSTPEVDPPILRRSSRISHPPIRYGHPIQTS